MTPLLQRWSWALGLLTVAWVKPDVGWAQQYLGNNLVTNGNFSAQSAGTNIAAGNDLGGWRSSRVYSGSGRDAAENQPAGQTGTATYRTGSTLLQRPFPGDAANGIAASNSWLLYNGNLGVTTATATTTAIVSSFIWYQDIQLVAGYSYVFSYYASNALNPTLSGKALPTVNFRIRNAANNANLANFGGTTFSEEATTNGQADTWQRVQYVISGTATATYANTAGSNTLRFVLSDGSTTAATDGGDVGLTGLSVRRINQLPRGQQTAPTVFSRQGIVQLPTLRADDPDPDGSVVSYKIKALPPASQGVLLLNGSPVRTNQVLTTAEAAALSFNPNQNFSGNALFTYTATDNVGDESLDLNYGIPMDANACNTQSVFSFASRPLTENWSAAQAATIDGITISSAYTGPSLAPTALSLVISDETGNDPATAQPGKGLVWTADYANDATRAAANRQSSLKFTFTDAVTNTSRFLNNFTIVVGDLDRASAAGATTVSGFVDQAIFSGTKADGTIVTLTAADVTAAPNVNALTGTNTVTGIGNSGSPAGNLVLAFPVPVRDVTITYTNAQAVDDPANQAITLLNLSWCGEADLATTLSGPTTAAAGQTVFYYVTTTNTGPRTTSSASTTITLPGKPAASTVNVPNGTYDASTGIVTFNTTTLAPGNSSVNYVSFVMPAGVTSFTGKAQSSALEIDNTAANNDGSAANANVTTTVGATGAPGTVLSCPPSPGKDGTVASLTAAPNTYFLPSGNAAANQKTIGISATTLSGTGVANGGSPLAPGDLVLIIQMQGAAISAANDDTYGDGVAGPSANGNTPGTTFTAGRYEYGVVAGTTTITPGTAGTLTLRDNLTYDYTQANATATQGQQRYQVIRIPQYTALTLGSNIAPPAWNGQLGGVLALDVAGPMNFNNRTLDASGAGFRGGAGRRLGGTAGLSSADYRSVNTSNGGKGEGTAGTPNYVATYSANGAAGTLITTGSSYPSGDNGRGAPGNAGGGGTDGQPTVNDQNTGGGGGANGGRGGRGGNSWASNLAVGGEPGAAFPLASSSRLVLGGGGGAGGTNDGTGNDGTGNAFDGLASSGAPGGGIVLVRTGSVTGAGSIVANGYNADNSVANDGSGGGGAGGTILLTAQNPNTLGSINLTATGGTGGTNSGGGVAHGPGGGGGGGFIVTNGPTASATAVAGTSGITFGNVPFGAETGTVGVGNSAISNSIAGSAANASCVADVVSVITGPATATAGSTVNLSVNFSNYGGITATGLSARVSLPASLLLANITAPGATITGGGTGPYILSYSALTSLAVGASQSFPISYTVPLTGSANITATSNITTASPEPYTANNPSSIVTNIGNYADVTTTITGPASVNPGLPTGDFTVNFTNTGPNVAQGITQSVTLPSGASITPTQLSALQAKYASSPVTIAYNTNTRVLSFTLNTTPLGNTSLAAGSTNSYSFPITASTTPGSAGITSNVGTSTTQTTTGAAGAGAQPDAATYNFSVAPLADLVATITNNGTATVAAGGTGTFVATFTNSGPSAADNVTPTVQLPAGLANVTFAGLVGSYDATTGVVTYPTTTTLASGSNLASTIRFTMPSSPVVAAASVNTASNEGPYTANNTATATISSSSNFDVTTTITGPSSAAPGTSVTLSVLTQNVGPGVAPSTTQTVVIPGVYTSLYVSNGGTFSNNGTNTTVTFPPVLGLASGANVNNTITLTMPAAPVNNITASVVAAGETNSLSNSASASIGSTAAATGNVNLYATIAAATADAPTTTLTGPVAPGTTLQLNIMTGNYGPTVAANSVTQVALPAGLSGVVPSNEGTYNATTGIVTFPAMGSLAQGASMNYTIQLPAPTSGPLVPVVSITSTAPETVVADNVASTKVDIFSLTDMATSISGPIAPTAGQSATYAVTTTNNGPTQAAGVVQTVELPAGLSSVTLTNANGAAITLPAGAYNATTGLLTLPTAAVAATQPAGASVLTYVTFTVPTSMGFPVTAAVSTTSQETVATNNVATLTTTPAPAADVNVALSGPSTTAQGNVVTYTVATTNAGPSVNPSSTTTVQLPLGLSNVQVSGGGSYNSSTGVVTFPALTDQAAGAAGAVSNTISFVAPTTTPLTVTAQVAVTPAGNDPNLNNNSATVNTTVNPSNTNLLDESTTIAATVGGAAVSTSNPVVAGGAVTFTATATNTNLAGTPSTAATNVAVRLQLPAGLNPANVILSNGSYDPATGVATFNTLGSQAAGASNSFTATINNVPGNATSLVAASYVSTTNSDSNPNNNVAPITLPFAPRADVTTTLSGPSTIAPNSSATYFVTTRNVGPSAASAVNTTVQLPAGLVGVVVSGGGSYDANTGLITFPTVASLPGYSGSAAANTAAQALEYTITMTAPSTITSSAGYTITSTVSTATTELATQAPNTASLTTTAANQPPVASNIVNSLQTPEGNTAQQALISPLQATDPDGSVNSYTLTSLPTSGTLYYNSGSTYTAITSANLLGGTSQLNLTPTQAQTLKYTPATGFAGNAFFNYLATDNGTPALASTPALYTIPVGADNAAVYANTPVKASAATYAANDVISFVTDNNGALYNASAQVYNTTSGNLQTGAANGIAAATSTGVFTSSQYNYITNLSQLGLVLNATTGQIQVQTPSSLLPGTYTLNITTTDQYNGITTQPVTFTIGGTPLPVVLVDFGARAVQQRDALLSWSTASEVNSAYFEVERSFDGTTFAAIGRVTAQGTKAAASTYTLTDAGVAAKATGAVYYRLRQVDLDGTATYSPQRTVSFAKVATVSLNVYPNPVVDRTTLDLSQLPAAGTFQVQLLDATGRAVRTWALGGGQLQPLELTGLASGSYLLVVAGTQPDGSPLRQALRLTKE
ncbi:hypothetical protein FNT36_12905 [Hymenobacter setariae]|uniref:DUF11 domain-containing protein n=1 Tax=Hymenobacter setariae TaxID=2594794 RepID=A0A558BV25_9BACT|nr:DUF11 domain-containing protein [Hymenobacter setariae]TVT40374.1 hypothetical protein FNT36_12905 [Hymenobacter setariae]